MLLKLSDNESALFSLMERSVRENKFTAWSCATQHQVFSVFYADEWKPTGTSIHPSFDLASLTKPLFLNCLLRHKLQAKFEGCLNEPVFQLVSTETPTGKLLSELFSNHSHLTMGHLLNHTSGAKPWFWFGKAKWHGTKQSGTMFTHLWDNVSTESFQALAKETLIRSSFEKISAPCGETIYSDINYYLLAMIFENLSLFPFTHWKDPLNTLNTKLTTEFWHSSLTPLKSENAIPYFPYVTTDELLTKDESEFFGPVHDTNANILGSLPDHGNLVSGHAGLFGNATDVIKAVHFLRDTQPKTFSSKMRFQFGLDTPSNENSSAGSSSWPPSKPTFGHLGFTGTSFWFTDEKVNVILTNRVASRKSFGAETIPRVTVITDIKTGSSRYFSEKLNRSPAPISEEELRETCDLYSSRTRVWDCTHLRAPPDLGDLRREAGKLLWKIT